VTLRIGNGAGFLGDWLDAPRRLVESSRLDYLTLEYLAELTLSILARVREKDPTRGFAADFLDVLASLTPALAAQPQLKIVTNAGGMNPLACAAAAGKILANAGLGDVQIGIVTGDDLADKLNDLKAAGHDFAHFDTGEPLANLARPIVSANAYLGARPIVEALAAGARIVITGRVADASLTVAPAIHEFGWRWDDWPRLAQASVAGHLIECGAQVTGGYSNTWRDLDLANVGYPIAELESDGGITITKPDGSGGIVNCRTVCEQLVYEIGDPKHYLTPDIDVDFTTVEIEDTGADRVAVHGATGLAPPDTLKVSIAYRDGFTASGQLLVVGNDAVARARACADIVFTRLKSASIELEATNVELLGTSEGVPGVPATSNNVTEVVLRITARDPRREAVERFTREVAPLITSGPAGLAGYAAGRPDVRPVFAYWPSRIACNAVQTQVEVRPASDWAKPRP
jgi:hypothetical protein